MRHVRGGTADLAALPTTLWLVVRYACFDVSGIFTRGIC